MTKRVEQKCEQHGLWLMEVSAEVEGLVARSRAPSSPRPSSKAFLETISLLSARVDRLEDGQKQGFMSLLSSRVAQLEDGQKQASALTGRLETLEQSSRTVAAGAKRALHTAMVVHQQQQQQKALQEQATRQARESQAQDDKVDYFFGPLSRESLGRRPSPDAVSSDVAELDERLSRRFRVQDERLDKVLHMVSTLTERVVLPLENQGEAAVDTGGSGSFGMWPSPGSGGEPTWLSPQRNEERYRLDPGITSAAHTSLGAELICLMQGLPQL